MSRIGSYEIEEELGRGGMGVVFRAYHPAAGRRVALKVIRPQPSASEAENAAVRVRFFREADAVGKLSHPNIVTFHEIGEERGFLYLVMEYVIGVSLETLLKDGPIEPPAALSLLKQIAGALDYAHSKGVVHRDVKPANILIQSDGQAKLTDFGTAHIQSQTITKTGTTMGTPAYMAPEQILVSGVDGKTDQFSLASSAYETLAGRKPFEAPTHAALFHKIVNQEPALIHSMNAALPESCAAVVSKALAKQPTARYANCTEFVQALACCFNHGAIGGRDKLAFENLDKSEITRLLAQIQKGNGAATGELSEILKHDLRRLADHHIKAAPNTFRPSRLAKEVYTRVFGGDSISSKDRAHFLAVVGRLVRVILVEHAFKKRSDKRAGGVKVTLAPAKGFARPEQDIEELNESLTKLERALPGPARVVELMFFGGLNDKQVAEVIGTSLPQIRRDWEFARAWLFHSLKG
jgi:RNA polymerase sigma factor (TIGR02999 family)